MVILQRRIPRLVNALILLYSTALVTGAQTPARTDANLPDMKVALDGPVRIAVDATGNLFVSDETKNVVFKIGVDGTRRIVAGTGRQGDSGDSGQAIKAELNRPGGLAVNSTGELFIADEGNERVRKVDGNGMISTVAGTGTAGFSGDGGSAIRAQLSSPSGVAVDSKGNLFIADRWNNRVRKITPDGRIITVAGSGKGGNKGDGKPAVLAELLRPTDVALDPEGNLFIADYGNDRVRKVTSDGNIVTVARVLNPTALAVDSEATLFVIDSVNDCIFEISASGYFSSLSCGKADDAVPLLQSSGKKGIAVDRMHNLYVADAKSQTITKISPYGGIATVVADGKGGADLAIITVLNPLCTCIGTNSRSA